MSEEAVDYFSIRHPLRGLASQISLSARKKMFRRFMDRIAPAASDKVLDVGVTPDRQLPESNFFEALYPYPQMITATSPEDASFLTDQYPGLTFVQTTGSELPFDNKAFDVAVSLAVIEHVGDRESQRCFVHELVRVGRKVFLTTPNRGFPIEMHTFLPLLHWLPADTYRKVLNALGMSFWAKEENLNLLSETELLSLFPEDARVRIEHHLTLGMPSNLIAIVEP